MPLQLISFRVKEENSPYEFMNKNILLMTDVPVDNYFNDYEILRISHFI